MKRKHKLLLVCLMSAALIATACGDSSETSTTTTAGGATGTTAAGPTTSVKNTASDTGVTETGIKIAIHGADLAGLVKAGAIKGVPEDADRKSVV